MTRIVLLGCAGAGKTTLARRLGARTGAPVICLDAVWRPHWGPDDLPRFRSLMAEAHAADAWISDGNFAQATFDLRLPRADLVVWLNRPRRLCAWRAIARTFLPGEAHRPADLLKVLRYIWNFDRINRPLIEAARAAHGARVPVVHLRSDAEIGLLFKTL
jgi:adenylate kinase family enzyme